MAGWFMGVEVESAELVAEGIKRQEKRAAELQEAIAGAREVEYQEGPEVRLMIELSHRGLQESIAMMKALAGLMKRRYNQIEDRETRMRFAGQTIKEGKPFQYRGEKFSSSMWFCRRCFAPNQREDDKYRFSYSGGEPCSG